MPIFQKDFLMKKNAKLKFLVGKIGTQNTSVLYILLYTRIIYTIYECNRIKVSRENLTIVISIILDYIFYFR